MAVVLMEFVNELVGSDGVTYEARACAREREDHLWEGWVEFVPVDGKGKAIRTGRETTQPNEADIRYWATGLTGAYLEGALARAVGSATPATPRPRVSATPAFEGPAERGKRDFATRAILDPFDVYRSGGDGMLEKQLGALDETNLRNIVRAHDLSDASPDELRELSRKELIRTIVAGVESRGRT